MNVSKEEFVKKLQAMMAAKQSKESEPTLRIDIVYVADSPEARKRADDNYRAYMAEKRMKLRRKYRRYRH